MSVTDCIHCGTPLPICLINHANHERRCCPKCDHPVKEMK